MRNKIPGLILGALLSLSAVVAGSQDEPPTFRSDAGVVVLDVVATDDKGRPIADLNEDDLQVSEDGTACRILSFRLVRAASEAAREPQPPSGTEPAESLSPTAPPQAATPVTETPARASLVVLVFDRLTIESAPLARDGAFDLVSQSFPPDTWFAVFKVGYGTRLLTPFTTDTDRLHSAIEAATLGDADKLGGSLAPELPPEISDSLRETPGDQPGPPLPELRAVAEAVSVEELALAETVEGLDSLYAVLGIARALSSVQGRKAVVYLAEAWHLPARTQHVYDQAVSEANRANVAIHTVDARGLSSTKPRPLTRADTALASMSAEYRGGEGGGDPMSYESGVDPDEGGGPLMRSRERIGETLSAPRLERLAQDTGGLAIQNTNDLGHGLTRVAQELGHYYEVVYAPANPVADGEFRRIRAKTRRRGVHLRTRVGYYATPGRSAAVHAYELPLLDALSASPEPEDFTLRPGLLHFAPRDSERQCLVLAEVPLSEVHLGSDEAAGVYRAHLAFLGYVKDDAGRVVARLTHDWPIEGPLDEKESARRRSAIFRRELSLRPGRYVLEAAAQDRQTGARSVARAALEVPSSRDGLALASIVVPRSTNAAAAGASGNDPLRVGSLSLVPDLGRTLEAGTRPALPVYVGVYPVRQDEGVKLAVELRRDDHVLAQVSPELPPSGAGGRAPWFGWVPTANLPPGSYEIAVTAKQGEEVIEDRTGLEIVPGPDPEIATARGPVAPELVPVLERAARYVVAYQDTFRNVVTEERYSQNAWGRTSWRPSTAAGARGNTGAVQMPRETGRLRRTSRADLVFVRLAGDVPWGVFRDVFQVDGSKVRDRDERLERLFREPSSSALNQARRILEESAHYNLGPRRTVNLPTLALLYLHPRNQSRFSFKKGGTRRFDGREGLEVEFEEIQRPTLTRDSEGRSVPVTGRFWIEASRGTVMRSEARYVAGRAEGLITTEYRREPRLAMWVPDEMQESYRNLPSPQEPFPRESARATARYSNYRRFQVEVDETATLPEP